MTVIRLIDKTGDAAICAALAPMASCIGIQCRGEVKRVWNLDDTAILTGEGFQDGEWPAFIVQTLDDPQALAYHDEENGYPALYVGRDVILNNGGTIMRGSNSISAAFSHEVLEALEDEFCDFYADWRDGTNLVALEICDPVEDGSYEISDGASIVTVSNFVHPEWFRLGASRRKYDHLGMLTAPLTLSPGGYVALRSGEQIFGKQMPEWRREAKRASSRRKRARHAAVRRLCILPEGTSEG